MAKQRDAEQRVKDEERKRREEEERLQAEEDAKLGNRIKAGTKLLMQIAWCLLIEYSEKAFPTWATASRTSSKRQTIRYPSK